MAEIEVLEAKLKALEKHVCFKFSAAEKALAIQSQEYERRLENLNHEAERLHVMQATYLPREVYEKSNDYLCEKVASLTKSRDEGTGKQYAISAMISLGIAIAGIAIAVIITG